jgi:DNA-binding NarL/FixJ family response regulator
VPGPAAPQATADELAQLEHDLVGLAVAAAVHAARRALVRAGAGFLLKDVPEEQLVAAIRVVAAGGSLFAPTVTTRLIEEFARRARAPAPPAELEELTPRELEVLRLVARGLSNAEIAATLVVSEHTTKTHVASVLSKLHLRSRVQAVVLAYETGS